MNPAVAIVQCIRHRLVIMVFRSNLLVVSYLMALWTPKFTYSC